MSQCLHAPAGSRPRYEVADVLRLYSADPSNDRRIPAAHRKVIAHLIGCRTAALGGHLYRCDHCGREIPVYNSCRDRHCPKCQTLAKEEWLDRRRRDLPPVSYFHTVFTLPHEINPLVLTHKKLLLGMLFRSASETLLAFGADPRWGMAGQLGFLAVLHTWTQTLLDHFHLHCLIPAGALSPDRSRWIPCPSDSFLFPVYALSQVFRAKFLDHLRESYRQNRLDFPGRTVVWKPPEAFAGLLTQLRRKEWVVYTKPPLDSPEHVLEYLARYTHRVAITNDRILSVKEDLVSFSYKDRSDPQRPVKRMTLSVQEFGRRFLLHVLPDGFQKIRSYGFLANRACQWPLKIPQEWPSKFPTRSVRCIQ